MKRCVSFVVMMCLLSVATEAQTILIRHANKDTAYIQDYYRKHLVVRAYESTKYNNFKFIDGHNKLVYKPNDHNNVGVGFTYRFISLNLGFYLPYISKDLGIYGRTKQLDLQTHLYLHKFIVDLYGQFYHGYYLANTDDAIHSHPADGIEKRPDIYTRDLSLTVQYVFNDKRFSYNAPFYQNELQKKSAGSFLLGGGIYYTGITADSSLVPASLNYHDFFNNFRFNKSNNLALGFNAGYIYTLVIHKAFFITAGLSGGTGINNAQLSDSNNGHMGRTGLELNLTEKFAAGYNVEKYFVGVTYIRLITENNSGVANTWEQFNTGNFRFTLAKRFRLKKSLIPKSELIKIE